MRVQKIYVVVVKGSLGHTKVSQEGYTTLEAAQEFCRKRADRPEEISPYLFKSIVNKYEIAFVQVSIK